MTSEAPSLLDKESHFAFGKNWASYAELIDESKVEKAVAELARLAGELKGKSILDIGCGSGIHSLAALRLGAASVTSLDLDPDSVATTQRVLAQHAPSGARWQAFERSVFDLRPDDLGTFDLVYSWGVLHHTGDMYRALRCAAAMVAPGGTFVFALYRRTHLCGFWKAEKRWYAAAGPKAQARAQSAYIALFRLATAAKGGDFRRYVAEYSKSRGMDFHHDVHDWLGGWPYESISPEDTERFMRELGLRPVRSFARPKQPVGILGSGCDEYVYARP